MAAEIFSRSGYHKLIPLAPAEMRLQTLLTVSLLFGLLLLICHRLYIAYFSPLRHVPGPFWAKFSRLWQILHYFRGTWHSDIEGLHEKYGAVVRIAPTEVSFIDHDALRKIYSHAGACPKTDWYHVWNPSAGKSISFFAETSIPKHAKRRRQVAQAYSMSSVLSAETFIQKCLDVNWNRFHEIATQQKPIDLDWWATAFAYDVVGELGFGESFDFVKDGEDREGIMDSVLTAFINLGNLGFTPGQASWVRHPVPRFLLRHFSKADVDAYPNFLKKVDARIRERRSRGESDRRDMLQQFFESKTHSGKPISHQDVLSEAANVLGAGADTTSIGIKACIGYLLLHPSIYQQLQNDLDRYWEGKGLTAHEITYTQCLEIPLLQAVIKESTRLHPSIIFQLPRHAPQEGINIEGHFIPGNMQVSMSPRAMNRSKKVFGPDANEFRPQRWLEDKEKAKYMDNLLTTFGYGSRSCIGKNIALVEMNKYVAQFVRQFNAELVNKATPWKEYTVWFCIQQEMWIKVHERRRSVDK